MIITIDITIDGVGVCISQVDGTYHREEEADRREAGYSRGTPPSKEEFNIRSICCLTIIHDGEEVHFAEHQQHVVGELIFTIANSDDTVYADLQNACSRSLQAED
jgi:hypothetical protein